MMTSTNEPSLLNGATFIKDLTEKVAASTTRIAIVVTTLHDDSEAMHGLLTALKEASSRGVAVSVSADSYTYVEPKEFLFRSPKKQPLRAFRAIKAERSLKSHGVDFRWLGRHGNITFAGRTHAKWMIVDDWVYSFGGINLDQASFENTDFMIRIRSTEVAERMFHEHARLQKADRNGHAAKSHSAELPGFGKVLIDGGLLGDSIIYRNMVRLAREAEDIVLVSQYCPTGRLSKILKRKHAKLYFNHWRQASSINRGIIGIGMMMSRHSTEYNRDNYLHAKCAIFTMPDGKKVALTGSHNFMFSGVLVGTREVALMTENPDIIHSLETFIQDNVT